MQSQKGYGLFQAVALCFSVRFLSGGKFQTRRNVPLRYMYRRMSQKIAKPVTTTSAGGLRAGRRNVARYLASPPTSSAIR